jgi:hypothetical protein
MDHKAALLALVLVSGSLAGCAGDPDEGGGDEFDSDALPDLFDEHFQDFLNNTTITVNNHYYNNTTYVIDDSVYNDITNVEYNNTTIVDGGEIHNYVTDNSNHSYGFGPGVNGTVGSNGLLFVVDLEWDAMDMFPEYDVPGDRNNSFEVTWTYWDYPTNQERTDTFQFDCTEYYIFETVSASNNTYYWGTYWESGEPYYDAWDNEYNDTIADILQNVAWSEFVQMTCDDDYVPSGYIAAGPSDYEYSFLNITVPEGFAIAYRQEIFLVYRGGSLMTYSYDYYRISEGHIYGHPRYADSPLDHASSYVYGGWDDITIEFSMYPGDYSNVYIWPDSSYHYTLYYELIPVMQPTE